MSDRARLILKVSLFALAVIILAWVIWALFFRVPSASVIPLRGVRVQEPGKLPDIDDSTGRQIVDVDKRPSTLVPEPEQAPEEPDVVASGGRTRVAALTSGRADFSALTHAGFNYYDWRDERFYGLTAGGESYLLSDEIFRSVENVAWSNNGESAILEFPDGSNIYYNFDTGERATLPKEAQEFTFSPNDNQLAYEYIGQAEDDRWIILSSPDGQGQQLIQPLGNEARNVKVDWSPNNQVIATFREPTSSAGEEVFFIGFSGENFLSLQTNGVGFEHQWSTKGKQVLYSVYNEATNYNPTLYIAGAEGDNIGLGNRSLRIQTWPDKCVFESEDYVYCAVPQYLDEGSGIFREQAYSSADTVYKIDLINNVSSPIAFPETDARSQFTIDQLMISDDGEELYFTDRVSGRIHRMRLR